MKTTLAMILGGALALTAANAQTAQPAASPTAKPAASAPAKPAKTPAAKAAPKPQAPRTAVSIDCSKQANAKGLHGKERKSFREKCKRAGGKG